MTDRIRRSMIMAAGAAAIAAPIGALAQAPREGKDFRPVRPAQPTDVPPGKIEVIEFFWYGCPHCNSLEPLLKDWVAKLPDDVVFRKLHVPFGERRHQQLFYTLESMGKAAEVNDAIFRAIHVDRDRLDTVDKMVALLGKHGIDGKTFRETFDSFAVRTKMRRAAQVVDAYGVDGVPAMAVNGKYYTAPSMVGSNAGALRMLDQLIEIERRARK
ncbi:thiol:disulfide interchange protein DsbA/DsbL [Burkholderiaceae bacterium FT117]|uniref:thiol:disulfide interchange protein DsbA/DsbL n=1 Tax=Zeimonas sediminis TaxID=2944268 RepID=UPI002342DBF0|nr:thiol:disulfide interchange protein DsbA/DsbL [Zeimonas sediminis]MCM5570994.1 thiol:disulfide interchange protein DsbA/DsbL [Zeimonas sediminis]